MKRDFTKFLDINRKECLHLLKRAKDLKKLRKAGKESGHLPERALQ